MIWSACFPFLTQKYKNDQILQYTDASELPPLPPPPRKLLKRFWRGGWSGERYRTTFLQTLTRKAKTHSRETKHSVYHDNNQNKTLKGDNLTDSHTRKATFAQGVNKIDLKESLPIPFPGQLNTHEYTHTQTHYIYIKRYDTGNCIGFLRPFTETSCWDSKTQKSNSENKVHLSWPLTWPYFRFLSVSPHPHRYFIVYITVSITLVSTYPLPWPLCENLKTGRDRPVF